jgi:hypothetical protein
LVKQRLGRVNWKITTWPPGHLVTKGIKSIKGGR